MPEGSVAEAPDTVVISDSAARRIKALRQVEGNPALMLRVTVSGGGCSGFQYGFNLDDKIAAADRTFEHDGVTVVIDEVSLGLLKGSKLDYREELGGAYFQVSNPNATSSCGCGSSFSV